MGCCDALVAMTDERDALRAELAASQAREAKLRDALSQIEYLESSNGCIMSAGDCSDLATEALRDEVTK